VDEVVEKADSEVDGVVLLVGVVILFPFFLVMIVCMFDDLIITTIVVSMFSALCLLPSPLLPF
jgi:hypothetical protein